jgi:hypothetical protein
LDEFEFEFEFGAGILERESENVIIERTNDHEFKMTAGRVF